MKLKDMVVAEWALELRPVDAVVVSRYRQAWRSGADFPPVVLDRKTKEVVSGNHRVSSALQEFGEDGQIPYELKTFKNQAERLRFMAEENARHGMAMDGFTRRKMAAAMGAEGMDAAEIAAIFAVPVECVESWAGRQVLVVGKGMRQVKTGLDVVLVPEMSAAAHEEHCRKDMGVNARHLVCQLTRWLRNGWVDVETLKEELAELKDLI